MESGIEFQDRLFEIVKEKATGKAADELADLLHVSTDSIYRRFRGETLLTIDELLVISRAFDIDLGQVAGAKDGHVRFKYSSGSGSSFDAADYFARLNSMLEQIENEENFEIIYAAKDIPIFYLLQFPTLCRFKLFFWSKTINESDQNTRFDPSLFDGSILDKARNVAHKYFKIPSVELWNEETITSLIRQIKYYYSSGMIEGSVLKDIENELNDLIPYLEKMVSAGSKHSPSLESGKMNYTVYYNEYLHLDNTILLIQGGRPVKSFVTFNAVNFMETSDSSFCSRSHKWIQRQIEKSGLITGSGEKDRNKLFNYIRNRLATG